MCGRYALYDISKAEFYIPQNMVGINYNISPGTSVLVVTENYDVKLTHWTFSVAWAEKLRIINARSETLEIKKIFQNTKRCIFIANGYFEWLRERREKKPFYHTFKDRMMYFGGVYNEHGACIITRPCYRLKMEIHQRQPVLLRYKDFSNWFSSKHDYSCEHSKDMHIYRVSSIVNSTKNNSEENISEISQSF